MHADHAHPHSVSHRDDSGSMVIAFLLIIMSSGIMLTLTAYTIAGHRAARFDRDHTRVVQGADVGVHEALFRLNLPAGDPERITAATSSASYPAWVQDLPPYSYRWAATPVSPAGTWQVEGSGLLNGQERRVTARVQQPRLFQYAAFADNQLRFVGANSANSYTATTWNTGEGRIGTNGSITLNGGVTADDAGVYDCAATSCVGRCVSNGNTICSGVDLFDEKMDVASDGAVSFIGEAINQHCPATPSAYQASVNGALAPGIYCFTTMDFDTSVTFSSTTANPVIVYLTNPTTNPTITAANRVKVNCATCDGSATSRPDAGALQIFTASYGSVRLGTHAYVAASLYAPRASCRGNPSNAQTHFYGSMVCATITNQGGWNFHYDSRLRDLGVGGFDIIRWAEQ